MCTLNITGVIVRAVNSNKILLEELALKTWAIKSAIYIIVGYLECKKRAVPHTRLELKQRDSEKMLNSQI